MFDIFFFRVWSDAEFHGPPETSPGGAGDPAGPAGAKDYQTAGPVHQPVFAAVSRDLSSR